MRAVFVATLGLGAADLVWLDLAIAPAVIGNSSAAPTSAMTASSPPSSPPTPTPTPTPTVPTAIASTAAILDEPVGVSVPRQSDLAEPVARVERIYFDSLSSGLSPAARDALATIARTATANIVVIGHSDHRGDPELNRELRLRRAMTVRDHLALLGISSERVHVRAADDPDPVDEPELWRERRVEIHFTSGGSR